MAKQKPGFVWTFEESRDQGKTFTPFEVVPNLIPTEAWNDILNVYFKQGVQHLDVYCGLYEGNYTPQPGDTMATFPTLATELTAYVSATRPVVALGTVANASIDNLTQTLPEFTGTTAGKSIAGGFICTSPVKGGGSGVLISAVKLATARPFDQNVTFRARVAFQLMSV